LADIMVGIGQDAITNIRERIIGSGTNAEGKQFPADSQSEMLVGCKGFKNKANCSKVFGKKKNKDLKWVTLDRTDSKGKKIRLAVLEGGYKKFRELNDLQTGFVDFTFSGRMWQNIKVVTGPENAKGQVRIKATSEEDNNKLLGNTKRKGAILKLSNSELTELSERFSNGVRGIFKKNGL